MINKFFTPKPFIHTIVIFKPSIFLKTICKYGVLDSIYISNRFDNITISNFKHINKFKKIKFRK